MILILNGSSQTQLTVLARCWDGLSITTSNHTFLCWIKPDGQMELGAAPTSNGTLRTTNTFARKASRSNSSGATTQIRTVVHLAKGSPSIRR